MTADKSINALDALAPLHAVSLKFLGYSDTFCSADVSEATRILSNFTDKRGLVNDDNYEQNIDEIRAILKDLQQAFTDANIK